MVVYVTGGVTTGTVERFVSFLTTNTCSFTTDPGSQSKLTEVWLLDNGLSDAVAARFAEIIAGTKLRVISLRGHR